MNTNLNKLNTISILGCGWYGLEMAKLLVSQGYTVKGSTTSTSKLSLLEKEGIQPFLVDFREGYARYDSDFFNSTLLIIAIPPKRNTGGQASLSAKIAAILTAAKKSQAVKNILFISSTAVYANDNEMVDESTPAKPETPSGKAILDSEKLIQSRHEFKTTILRFAGLIGPGRDPGRFFAGKRDIPNGLAPINLIHLNDCLDITMQIIVQNAFGYVFNACTPHHPPKQEFYTRASLQSGLTKPIFINELKQWKTITSTQLPLVLQYKYLINNWTDWLAKDKL